MLITTAMTTPYSLLMVNSPSFLPPTLLQSLSPHQPHQSLTYWDHIKHEKRPAGTVQLSHRERLDNGQVTTQKQSKKQCKENIACSNVSNLNTTSSYPCIQPHPLPPLTSTPRPPARTTSPASALLSVSTTLLPVIQSRPPGSQPSMQVTTTPFQSLPSAMQ
jgi:hypothetical protein